MLGVSPDLTSPNHNPNTNNNNNNNHTPLRPPDGGAMVAPPAEAQESGGTSGGSCGDGGGATHGGLFLNEEGEKTGGGGGGGGSRWPRQETLALLKIRSDMDLAFRDSSLKGPLWEDVSRKMAELGYHRNAKKCKEKFENVYKYHKRTKEGRSSKADGKTYRFFDQLQALDNIIGGAPPPQPPPPSSFFQSPPPPHTTPASVTMAVPIQAVQPTHQLTVSSTPQNNTLSFNNPFTSSFSQPEPPTSAAAPPSNFFSNSPSSSSSTSSDEDVERRHKRKRKYKDLFESLMKTVVEKQADFQRKFLETLDQREKGRMLREEAWRAQEIERLKNEHHLLIQERSNAAARESTLISLLQKITQNQQNPNFPNTSIVQQQETTPTPPPPVVKQSAPPPLPPPPQVLEPPSTTPRASTPQPMRQDNNNNGGLEAFNTSSASSSRWPKAEIDALINLRTYLDNKYQENGPKGPLWEEISSEMKKIGYNRNSKRCKEKWENINKYFKKVKESNKKRPQDSKTCPYFHQLEALYKEKEKYGKPENSNSNMPIIDARPEQQWPLLAQEHLQEGGGQVQNQVQQAMEEREGENNNNNNNVDDDDEEYDDDGEDDDDDEEDEGSGYEIVTNKQPSSVTTTT